MVAGVTLERAQRVEMMVRRSSDAQLELAQEVYELLKLGDWREQYASFIVYAVTELRMLPGRVRELLRMQRKLAGSELDSATASEIGWDRLRLIPLKTLQSLDRETVLEELASESVLSVRDKYCPRTPRHTPRQTCCSATVTPCGERH